MRRNIKVDANVTVINISDDPRVTEILKLLRQSASREKKMALDLSELVTEVASISDVVASGIATIDRLADELEAAAGNPDQVAALVTQLRDQKEALAEAIANPGTEDPPA